MAKAANAGELQGLIREIQLSFSSFYAKSLEPFDVSLSQFAVLLALAQRRPRKMSEIGYAIRVSMPAVTHLADRLEAKQLIKRKPHPTDRRTTLLDMTPKGLEIVKKTQGKTLGILTKAYTSHPAAAQQAIFRFLNAMRAGLKKATDEVSYK